MGVDCSGLTSLVMEEFFGIQIPRSSEEQFKNGAIVRDDFIQSGDLVFFKNVRGVGVDHVGIYLGDSKFIHASQSRGVMISDIEEDYYSQRFAGARRYQ